MTQEDFDNLIEEIREEDPISSAPNSWSGRSPTEEKLANFEQKAGFQFPEEYRHFLKKFGCGEIGTVTILSPDPESQFSMWDGKEEFNRETGFPFAEDSDGNFYAFLVENGNLFKRRLGRRTGSGRGSQLHRLRRFL